MSDAISPPTTVDPAEIARFAALAETWWDPTGPSAPLHRINPVRLGYIRERLIGHFGRDATQMRPFDGLSLVDVGCGGGLVAEPMARMGFAVTGIDATADHVPVAGAHAVAQGLAIDYRAVPAETLAAEGTRFDVVLALEIIEHVADPATFVGALAELLRPGGVMVLSTLNRTPRSMALGIVAAEYVLRWVPRGTHRWSKFVKPSELAALCRQPGLMVHDVAGMSYAPLGGAWSIGRDLSVNYLMVAGKPNG